MPPLPVKALEVGLVQELATPTSKLVTINVDLAMFTRP